MNAPVNATFGTFTVTVPLKLPVIPAASIVSTPAPPLTLTRSVEPPPRPTYTLATVSVTFCWPPTVFFSNVKSPRSF